MAEINKETNSFSLSSTLNVDGIINNELPAVMIDANINQEPLQSIANLKFVDDGLSHATCYLDIEANDIYNNSAVLNADGLINSELSTVMIDANINQEPLQPIADLKFANDDISHATACLDIEANDTYKNSAVLNTDGIINNELSAVMIDANIKEDPFQSIVDLKFVNDGLSQATVCLDIEAEESYMKSSVHKNYALDTFVMKSVEEVVEKFGKPICFNQDKMQINSYKQTFKSFSNSSSSQLNIVVVNLINVEGDVYENDIDIIS